MKVDKEPMTIQGAERLKQELKHAKSVLRPAIVKAIEEARAHGDLSENAEYDAAKNQQGLIEARLREIEDKLARAEIIDPSKLSGTRVMFGAQVKLFNVDAEEEVTYRIVGEDEADLRQGKINFGSPLAKQLIGREEGDEVKVRLPNGVRTYEVMEVRFDWEE